MTSNYEKLLRKNLHSLYNNRPENLDTRLPAVQKDNLFHFRAFGEDCCLGPEGINLSGKPAKGTEGLLISLYAIHVGPDPVHIEPLKAFRDLPGSMPYQNAFTVNSERVLIPYVSRIREVQGFILDLFNGQLPPEGVTGDFSFVIYPLPKIALCYIFYLPDEKFPASCTCLFSANAPAFMPIDGLADVAEYTSRRIIQLID
jgi:hypothetical protein